MQKEFQLAVDIERKIRTPSFEVNTLDLKTVKLLITIIQDMSLVDLTGITVRMSIQKPDKNVLFQECEVVNAKAGLVEIVLDNQAYLLPGKYEAELMCFQGAEVVAVTGSFSYTSAKGILTDEAVESKSEFTAITEMVRKAQDTLDDLKKNGTGIDAEARQEVTEIKYTFGQLRDFKSIGESIVEKSMNEFTGRGVNPEWFGASEENDDNYSAIKATFDHISNMMNGRGKIVFPAGKVIKLRRPLNHVNISDVFIDLNGSTLDFSRVQTTDDGSAIHFTGTQEAGILLTANAPEKSREINCDTSSFLPGDMVKVYSNKIWDSQRTSTRIGEITFIESITSASQMVLTTPLNDSYNTADAASVAKINYIKNVSIVNGNVIGATGNNELRGIRFRNAVNCVVDNIRTFGFDVNHYQLTDCVNCVVNKAFMEEATHTTMGYGVSFADACRDCICSNSTFTNIRHSLSTNNNVTASHGITRRILFIGNIVTDSALALTGSTGDAVDTHAGADDIFIINNDIFSSSGMGINVEANRAMINGNRIKITGSVGISFTPKSDLKKSAVMIVDNQITDIGDAAGTDYGILVTVSTTDCDSVVISNNEVTSKNGSIRVTSSGGKRFRKGTLVGNSCEVIESGYGIQIENAETFSITGGSITAPNFGVAFTNVESSTVNGVPIKLVATANTGYGIRLLGDSKYNAVTGNAVKNAGSIAAASVGVKIDDTATNNGVFGNVTNGMPGGAVALGAGAGNRQANNI